MDQIYTVITRCLAATLLLLGLVVVPNVAFAGGTYRFTVTCPSKARTVVEWRTGMIDPGHEAFRVSTGTLHPGCSVSGYNPAADASAPVIRKEGAEGVLDGARPLAPIVFPLTAPIRELGKLFRF